MINDSNTLLQTALTNLQDQQIAASKKLQDFVNERDKIDQFFRS